MVTHTKGQKYILSASISHEVGKVLDERNKVHGIIKSFEVEQALRQYYGLDSKNLQSSRIETPASSAVAAPTTTTNADPTNTTAATQARVMSTTSEGISRRVQSGSV